MTVICRAARRFNGEAGMPLPRGMMPPSRPRDDHAVTRSDRPAARRGVGGDDEGRSRSEQHDGDRQQSVHRQPASKACHAAEHRERTNAAKTGLRSAGMAGPLTLEPDHGATERGDAEAKDGTRFHAVSLCSRVEPDR